MTILTQETIQRGNDLLFKIGISPRFELPPETDGIVVKPFTCKFRELGHGILVEWLEPEFDELPMMLRKQAA